MDQGTDRHFGSATGRTAADNGGRPQLVDVRRREQAVAIVEGGERASVYFESTRLAFATAVLPAGESSSRDPGHPGAHEVVYCVEGTFLLDLADGTSEVQLAAGDAALIHEGVPHLVHNPGPDTAVMVWCAAPSLGRPAVPPPSSVRRPAQETR
jgi:mannose-6-phosphate isomerase-like protein (cupin superfamily)